MIQKYTPSQFEVERLRAFEAAHRQLQSDLDTATRERDEARAEVERLREALQGSACACSSIRECASDWAKDGHCPHFGAAKALEAKP